MGRLSHSAARAAAGKGIDIIIKNKDSDTRTAGILKLVDFMEDYMNDVDLGLNYNQVRKIISDKDCALNRFINRALDELDPKVVKRTVQNLGFEAFLYGTRSIRKNRIKYDCNIPWLILMDPTSSCNLHCTGCWAAEYGNKLNLTYDEMSNVVEQGKKLGVYLYMFTGGEPLVRKDDLIRLCRKHKNCQFFAFTNGTLIDEAFCQDLKSVKNLMLGISLEGSPEVNDLRRGKGVYAKVMHSMDLLKENGIIFGTSICYTSKNYESVTSREFIKLLVEKGCRYSLYFHYMPVGNDASVDLLLTPEQRIIVKDRIREIRRLNGGEGLFTMDFQNDGEFVGGCIAGGKNYFHINANGDAEPCVFIHYSNTNIRDNTLLEILRSPLFMAYHNNQPFNDNHLRPCPMLENPEILKKMVHETDAHSTDLQSNESVEHLCNKCYEYADNWKITADKIWHTKEKM